MGTIVKLQGFVALAADCGEADRMLTLITREYGKLSVYARGCRKLTSKTMTCTQQLACGDYVINRTEKLNVLQEGAVRQSFFGLRRSIEAMALASYISEVTAFATMFDEPEPDLYDLTLNAIYLLSEQKKPCALVKAAYELRTALYLGLAPDTDACRDCGKADGGQYMLDIMNGNIVCADCYEKAAEKAREKQGYSGYAPQTPQDAFGTSLILAPLSQEALAAVRYVTSCEPGRTFSFNVTNDVMHRLSYAAEKYLTNHLERDFSTLDFYKDIKN